MSKSNRFRLPFTGAAALGAPLLFAGCQPIPPVSPESVSEASLRAVDGEDFLRGAISFRSEGDAVDVPNSRGLKLTLPDAMRRTLETDPRIQAALSRVQVALAESRQVRLLPNPIISVAFRIPTGSGKPEIEAGLAQEFISLLQRPGLARAADGRLRAAAADAVSAVLDSLAEVQERFAAVQAQDRHVVVLEGRRKIIERLHEQAEARLKAGESTTLDLYTAETQRVELEAEIAEKVLERREERLTLARLIGEPSGDPDRELEGWSTTAVPNAPEAAWISAALERRPEVQTRSLEIDALTAERGLTRFEPFSGSSLGVAAERDDRWTVGPSASLPIPIFDVGQARRERADAALSEAKHKLTEAKRQVVEETRRAYSSLTASQANLARVRDQLVPLQTRRRDQAEAQFRAGQTDITALLLAEQDLRAAQAREIDLERKALTSLVRLERAVGGRGVARSLLSSGPASGPTTSPSTRPAAH